MKQRTFPGHEPAEATGGPMPTPRRAATPPLGDSPSPESTVCVIDAHSLIFQVFHAIPEMTSPKGEPVSAVFGFLRDVLFLIEDRRPDFLIAAFDMPGPTFRHNLYDAYKADRGEMPTELRSQIPKIKEMLEALAVPVVGVEGFEADDVLATVGSACDEIGARCVLVTGDKDCRQLITPRVS